MKRQLSSKYLGEVLFITEIDKQIKEDRISKQLGKLVLFYSLKQARWEELDKKENGRLQKKWNSTNTRRAIQAAIVRMREDYEKRETVEHYFNTMDKIERFLKRYGEEYSAWAMYGNLPRNTNNEGTL